MLTGIERRVGVVVGVVRTKIPRRGRNTRNHRPAYPHEFRSRADALSRDNKMGLEAASLQALRLATVARYFLAAFAVVFVPATASFNSLPGVNLTRLRAGTLIFARVCGFTRTLGAVSFTEKTPKPTRRTESPASS